jgi:hypothetical protein
LTARDADKIAKILVDAPATKPSFPQAGLVSTMTLVHDRASAKIPVGEQIEDIGQARHPDGKRTE